MCKKNIDVLYTMNQNKYSPQSAFIKKSYGSVNVYDDIRDKWITLQTHQIGDLKFSAHELDHHGWMICDGRSLSRTDYEELYDIIGIQFGSNHSSTFKIPDMRGRVAGGIGDGPSTTNRPLGTSLGEEEHTLTVGEMPTHNHGVTDPGHAHSITDPGHTHGYQNQAGDNGPSGFSDGADNDEYNQTTGNSTTDITVNSNTTGITTVTAGNSLAHNNMQPTLFIGNMFIYSPSVNSAY
jgi:microcystin-dependent protein|uniref:Phage tail collar domain-containing protein n=2 Tax=viral metagenome TaxID=1070528 RepID=A0A6C0ALD8_9ZZZZ